METEANTHRQRTELKFYRQEDWNSEDQTALPSGPSLRGSGSMIGSPLPPRSPKVCGLVGIIVFGCSWCILIRIFQRLFCIHLTVWWQHVLPPWISVIAWAELTIAWDTLGSIRGSGQGPLISSAHQTRSLMRVYISLERLNTRLLPTLHHLC